MKYRIFLGFAVLSLFFAACAPAAANIPPPATEVPMIPTKPEPAENEDTTAPESPGSSEAVDAEEIEYGELSTQTDNQGAVAVTITPRLGQVDDGSNTLVFEVALETHSVDLSMDLAKLTTLQTDTGVTVQAVVWDAPRGGHHVAGTLQFPSVSGGQSVLAGATFFTLIVRDVDAPERKFTWQLEG